MVGRQMGVSFYSKKDIQDFVNQLKKEKIGFFDVPEEIRNEKAIVDIERKLGLRKSDRRGYDVIKDLFFVEEIITFRLREEVRNKNIRTVFKNFDSYYLFLDGDIFENSCYYQLDFSNFKTAIDTKKLSIKAFETRTIDDYVFEASNEEIEKYNRAECNKRNCKRWIKKFNKCSTYEELNECVNNYKQSSLYAVVSATFFFYQYIYENVNDKNRFRVIMEFMSHGKYPSYLMIYSLCSIYNPEDVIAAYDYSLGSKQTVNNYKKRLKDHARSLNSNKTSTTKYCYFDSQIHYYYEKSVVGIYGTYRYFEDFKSFISYRKGDLRNCDISNVIGLNVDFSIYMIDSTTKLPLNSLDELDYVVNKMYENQKYIVNQIWYDKNKNVIKQYNHDFNYFFDFVAFLKGDLSNADLLFCDGLINLKDLQTFNLAGIKLTSKTSERLGIKYEKHNFDKDHIQTFEQTIENEKETVIALQTDRRLGLSFEEIMKSQMVYYITDLHLTHRIKNADCKSKNDIIFVLKNIIEDIFFAFRGKKLILIGGDTSSDFFVFNSFIKLLSKTLEERKYRADIIFLLGNHELWGYPGEDFTSIVSKYNSLLREQGMYLLQNDILYIDADYRLNRITTEEFISSDKSTIRKILSNTRLVIFGGLAFSGYNEEFNANNGIYRNTIGRQTEIEETQKFEKMYNLVCDTVSDKNLIVFTHTPKKDWCKNPEPQKNIVYVSGHTHRNYFYDDGEYRIYADNQLGYYNENPKLKYFYLEDEYDCFSYFEDGIHTITGNQYNDFFRGMNIQMSFTRKVNILYMLKRNGYYCFIHRAQSGSLSILNGGALKKLDFTNIHYYYNNMDKVIAHIKKPLDSYTKYQEKISNEIEKIGGSGTIHGCIIDIDYFNHIYVNPSDMSITGYWAADMINKEVYPNIPALLREECPHLYNRYQKLLKGDKKNKIAIKGNSSHDLSLIPVKYLDTDIYKASREVKKMQKLSSNILSVWYEPTTNETVIEKH